jgi:DNA invertase Pin-like site-specific DNA recombinase
VNVGLDTSTPSGRLAVAPRDVGPLPWAPAEDELEPAAELAPPDVEAPAEQPEPEVVAPVEEAGPSAPEAPPAEPAPDSADGGRPTAAPEPPAPVEPPPPAPVEPPPPPPVEPAQPAPPPVESTPPAPAPPTTPAPREPTPVPAIDGAGAAAPRAPVTAEATRALGYASVPTDAEAGGSELDLQRQALEGTCKRFGLELVEVVREREPKDGKALDRAGLSYLIGRIAAGEASCIVVTGLERLSRSVSELGTLVQWLERNEVRLVADDLNLDTATPGGRTTARALASVGGWERERLSERTRKGLAAARAKRRAGAGPTAPDWTEIRKRIAAMRADGMTLQAIADVLNEEGVPTQRGGKQWRPSSVQTAAGYKRRTKPRKVDDLPAVKPPKRGRSE